MSNMVTDAAIGVDSGTQSVKVVVLSLADGRILAEGRAPHTPGVTQDPEMWWRAMVAAVRSGLNNANDPVNVRGIAITAQQHGLVMLDADDQPVRAASLWNHTASAPDAERLNALTDFASETGTRLVASISISKLAYLARTAPEDLARTVTVCLPHDYLTYRLTGNLVTDRGDASGTGWWSPKTGELRRDLLALAVGPDHAQRLRFPRVLGPNEAAGSLSDEAARELGLPPGIVVGCGTGDNMAAALGNGAEPGHLTVSLGTSGTAFTVSETLPGSDPTGEVCGFADATGRFLPLTCLLNCTRVVEIVAQLVGMNLSQALAIAGSEEPGAGGLILLPYFNGERTPNLPDATGQLTGMVEANLTPIRLVRAAVDGVAAGLAYCVEALARVGQRAPAIELVGGGAMSRTWQQAIADATGLLVHVRESQEHAARGAGIQAAALVLLVPVDELAVNWQPPVVVEVAPRPELRERFALDQRRTLIEQLKGT